MLHWWRLIRSCVKLAHASGAPIIPVGIWGTERVWPRSAKAPHVTNVLAPPTVRIRVGEPVDIKGTDVDEDTTAMMSAISDLLPAEARERREPTPEELAATYPDGRVPANVEGAAAHEGERRPGTD